MIQSDFTTQLRVLDENLKQQDTKEKKILLNTSDALFMVRVMDILYCEADQSYTRIYLLNGDKVLVSKNLLEYDDMLKEVGFFRVHKSYLVNMLRITKFEKGDGGFLVMENSDRIPVASRKRDELMRVFEKLTT